MADPEGWKLVPVSTKGHVDDVLRWFKDGSVRETTLKNGNTLFYTLDITIGFSSSTRRDHYKQAWSNKAQGSGKMGRANEEFEGLQVYLLTHGLIPPIPIPIPNIRIF